MEYTAHVTVQLASSKICWVSDFINDAAGWYYTTQQTLLSTISFCTNHCKNNLNALRARKVNVNNLLLENVGVIWLALDQIHYFVAATKINIQNCLLDLDLGQKFNLFLLVLSTKLPEVSLQLSMPSDFQWLKIIF